MYAGQNGWGPEDIFVAFDCAVVSLFLFFFSCLDEGMTLTKISVMMLCYLTAMNDWYFMGFLD